MAEVLDLNDIGLSEQAGDVQGVNSLDLNDINFSCVANDKESDEFDYGDEFFQRSSVLNKQVYEKLDSSAEVSDEAIGAGDRVTEEKKLEDVPKSTDTKSNELEAKVDISSDEVTRGVRVDLEIREVENDAVPSSLLAAEAEWDAVQCIEAGYTDSSEASKPVNIQASPLITFSEALQYFQTLDLSHLKPNINTTVHRRGLSAIRHLIFGPPSLNKDLVSEKDMMFCMAASNFENGNQVHCRVLQTIYRTLTGSKFDCPRFGSHFEEIGFQGNDPSTDLRGSGLLGLMQILHLLTDQRTLPLARDIYRLSSDEVQNFPFCLMGINISRITLQAVREGCLNKEFNRRKQVVAVMNDFYIGTYLHMYEIWKKQNKTIEDSGFVIKEVEAYVKKNPKTTLKKLESVLTQKNRLSISATISQQDGSVVIDRLP